MIPSMKCPEAITPSGSGSETTAGAEALVLLTYLFSIALLVAGPFHLFEKHFPHHPPWFLDKAVYAPLLGLLFLVLASLCYQRKSIIDGAMISDVIRDKIGIIVLILSFAYLSISLDMSGFFKDDQEAPCATSRVAFLLPSMSQVSAVSMVRAAKGDGLRLLIYFYLMCSLLTYFTSNDIVIISMTPIVVHTCSAGIFDCVPLLITQFIAANTSSMGLLIGSPSNIIFGDAVGLTFMRYWALMMLPTIVAVLSTLVMVMVVFVWLPTRGHVMQRRFLASGEGEGRTGEEEPSAPAAGGGGPGSRIPPSEYGGVELVVLEGEELVGIAGNNDVARAMDGARQERADDAAAAEEEEEEEEGQTTASFMEETSLLFHPRVRRAKVAAFFLVLVLLSVSDYMHASLWSICLPSSLAMLVADLLLVHRDGRNPVSYLRAVYDRMPWAIAPFVVCMFLLVQALSKTGFVGHFARWMIRAGGQSFFRQSMAYGYISALLVNVLNDLPSTVFWSLMAPTLCTSYSDPRQYTGVIMALLVGVNPGCYLSIIGALAGLMWRNIIRTQPGVDKLCVPTAWDLTYYGALVLAPVTFITCASVSIIAPLAR